MKPTNEQIEKAQRILKPIGLRIGHTSQEAILNAILALTQEPEEEWPKEGCRVFRVWGDGAVDEGRFTQDEANRYRLAMGTIFRTEAEAIAHRDRILSGKVRVVYQEVE